MNTVARDRNTNINRVVRHFGITCSTVIPAKENDQIRLIGAHTMHGHTVRTRNSVQMFVPEIAGFHQAINSVTPRAGERKSQTWMSEDECLGAEYSPS